MKAKFHIPDIWVHKDLNLYLIDMIKEHPEFFYDDIGQHRTINAPLP